MNMIEHGVVPNPGLTRTAWVFMMRMMTGAASFVSLQSIMLSAQM